MLDKQKLPDVFHPLVDNYNEIFLECRHMKVVPFIKFNILRRTRRLINDTQKVLNRDSIV